ncbi:polyamine-transporting ATPase 13A3-like isoform 1-T1 [Syngnathus typhle]
MKSQEVKLVNKSLEDEMEVWGYRLCHWKIIVVGIGTLLSGGLLLLLLYSLPEWGVKATCTLTSLREAQTLRLRTTDDFKQWFRAEVKVMAAPGKTPFDNVDHQSKAQMDGEDPKISQSLLHKERIRKSSNTKFAKVRYFIHHSIKYYWNEGSQTYESFQGLEDAKVKCAAIHTDHSSGLTKSLQKYRAFFFGENVIDVKNPFSPKHFIKEALNPYYILLFAAFILWFIEGYYYYSLAILLMAVILIAASFYNIRKNHVKLHKMVEGHCMVRVSVCRGNEGVEQVTSTELVPGDVITIPANGMIMPCDAVLICGTCTVDESMLTGESVPVTKNSAPTSGEDAERIYDTEKHRHYTLFCGSHVIQSRHYGAELVKVVVVKTGFSTKKGQLVHSILYPKPTIFKLHREATQFLMCMGVVGMIGFVYSIISNVINELPVHTIIFQAFNIIFIAVPVFLPMTLTVGLVHAQRRLKRDGISCISPQRINISGQLNLVCFDKTGTLTENSLDLWGIQRAENGTFSAPNTEEVKGSLAKNSFVTCMATCHSLTNIDGKLCGDPLDVKVFSATGSILEQASEKQTGLYNIKISTVVRFPQQSGEFAIVRQLPFCSALQRMSVVVQQLGQKHLEVYLKGAPETVANLCKPQTVPQNFIETLETYTRHGLRVIALAHHQLESELSWSKLQSLSREQIETDMDFLGLIIMQNKIKEQTAVALLELRRANIRTLMVTGDNMLTAISVARDCGMIPDHEKVIIADAMPPFAQNPAKITWRYLENPVINSILTSEIRFAGDELGSEEAGYHFAVSGQSFNVITEHFPQLLQKLLLRATVFARMTPDQKTQLVQALQSIDYCVGMCGDGANDCGALKKAHSGIALSELEASVASPFTSTIPNISCITNLIRQGRAALVTSFCVFKLMAVFSLSWFCNMIMLFMVGDGFGDFQYIFIDFGISMFIPFTMSLNPAWNTLVHRTPPSSLLSGQMLSSVFSQILNNVLFQCMAFVLVQQQSWYQTPESIACNETGFSFNESEAEETQRFKSFENTSIFYVSTLQFLIVAIVFSKGKPFRKPSYKNWSFVLTCSILYAFILFIMLHPISVFEDLMEIGCLPYDWRITLLIISIAHAVVCCTVEMVNDRWGSAFFLSTCCRQNRPPKKKYKCLKLQDEADWPPAPSTISFANTAQYHRSVTF